MATIKKVETRLGQFGGFLPYGNMTTLRFGFKTNSTGAVIDSDTIAAVASGDVIDLGELPEGMRLEDAQVIITTALTASVTGSLGFKYVDGVDSTEVPQDAAYFISSGAFSSAGRLRANGSKLVVLPKPARLILTTGGAANAKASEVNILVMGELKGPR